MRRIAELEEAQGGAGWARTDPNAGAVALLDLLGGGMYLEAGAAEFEGAAGWSAVYVGEESGNLWIGVGCKRGLQIGTWLCSAGWGPDAFLQLLHGADFGLISAQAMLIWMARG